MTLSAQIREQIINSFRAELNDHVQTINDGLLALEQHKISGKELDEILANLFRAAHSLKGAARAVGVSAIEQLAHALEDVLGVLQKTPGMLSKKIFTACYKAIDAIQIVQLSYEAGELTPPVQALQALADLAEFRKPPSPDKVDQPDVKPEPAPSNGGNGNKKASPQRPSKSEKDRLCENNLNTLVTQLNAVVEPEEGETEVQEHVAQSTLPEDAGSVEINPAPTSMPVPQEETIRVSVSKLDGLMDQLSELLVTKIHAEQHLAQMRQAQGFMAQWQKEWLAVRSDYSRLTRYDENDGNNGSSFRFRKEMIHLLEFTDSSQNRLREMITLINKLSREYHSDTMQMSLVIDGLEEEIKRIRMLPFNTITGTFGRMVRDLAHASGKEAVLEISGGDVELDKRVLEQIKDPILHLLRNAIDHGIETIEKRLSLGKPSLGTVRLIAEQTGKDVSITVSDDGAGLDLHSIRQAAMRRGVPEAASLTEAELVELIFNPGFSTSLIITDISGRGVGLDVVRRNIENLHGAIDTQWKPGQGSSFTLTLPVSMTSSRGLMVRVSGQSFSIPLNAIERIEFVNQEEIVSLGGQDALHFDGRPILVVHLADILGLPRMQQNSPNAPIPVVILTAEGKQMAFAVDDLADELEVVVKGLGKQLTRVGGIAGASVMGNGEVILILNVVDLIKLVQHGSGRSFLKPSGQEAEDQNHAEHTQKRILVVDDSITTRTLEKNILEAAGYFVQIATDGQEALNQITTGYLPDLIISDVSMPVIDGFTLTERIRSKEDTREIPLILVTSRDAPEDKARGIEVGADAYIVKSHFDQNNLLETIEQLI